ncbi:MAG: pyridoxal phosphate-dependent aminotransferase [Pseudomonadota bacterium]
MIERFARNDIMSLTESVPRYDLAESVGPDLRLGNLSTPEGFEDLAELPLGYGTAAGDIALRTRIAESHGVDPDEVVITVGGMHALFLTAFVTCRPGTSVVAPAPLFPNALNAIRSVGAAVSTIRLTFDTGYAVDPAALRDALRPDTALVYLASPQNPSGVALTDIALAGILEAMQAICPDAFLLIDETYREAVYGDDPVAPSLVHKSPRIVSCASLSKCHGAPGLRIGWAIVRDPALREQIVLGKFNTVISCSRVDEALVCEVLDRKDAIIADRRRHLSDGLERTRAWVAAHAPMVEWIRPDAGALCCVRLAPSMFDAPAVERFYACLAAEDARVGNGTWFGDEARILRLGFGLLDMPELEAGFRCLSRALDAAHQSAA